MEELDTDSEARIGIAWWNTSLSPLGKSRAKEQDKVVASNVVRALVRGEGIDCLALGEVTAEDLQYLLKSCALTDYTAFDRTLRLGSLQFDVGVLYNRAVLGLADSKEITSEYGQKSLKVAQRLDLITKQTNEQLFLFVSHWPSRIWCHENSAPRDALGLRLRDYVKEVKDKYSSSPQIIIAGDFNDEPFDKSLSGHLLASRDRALVMKDDCLFYNPFWRHLGETSPYIPGARPTGVAGTCFYDSGQETKWRTFDQIIVSSSFLRDDRWSLNEEYTGIFHYPSFIELVRSSSCIFDHCPVISIIQRRLKNKGGEQ